MTVTALDVSVLEDDQSNLSDTGTIRPSHDGPKPSTSKARIEANHLCSSCERVYTSKSRLNQHYNAVHLKPQKCVCGYKNHNLYRFNSHKRKCPEYQVSVKLEI